MSHRGFTSLCGRCSVDDLRRFLMRQIRLVELPRRRMLRRLINVAADRLDPSLVRVTRFYHRDDARRTAVGRRASGDDDRRHYATRRRPDIDGWRRRRRADVHASLHAARRVRLVVGDVPADDVRPDRVTQTVAGRRLELLKYRHLRSVNIPAPDLPLQLRSRRLRRLHVSRTRHQG